MTKPKKSKAEQAVAEVMDRVPTMLNSNVLYNEFIGLTNIERVKEEDYVLRELLRGVSKNQIIENLKAKHTDTKFNYDDLERFLARNQDVVRLMGKEVSLSARRHLEARAQCSEVLAGVALYTQNLIKEFREEGDRTNTVAAIRALNTTLENYMKLEGMLKPSEEGGRVLNVIQMTNDKKSRLSERVHNANFIQDVEILEDEDEDGEVQ